MIEDIQIFQSISQNEDTKIESVVKVAFNLSEIETLNEDAWSEWQNTEPKTDVFLKSGLSITLLETFDTVVALWQRFKAEQKQVSILYKYN